MLGGREVGKTCFTLGMYGIMQSGVRGFSLTTADPDQELDLYDSWVHLLGGGAERWPAPNGKVHSYKFDLNYAFQRVMGFELVDYRVGAVPNEDVAELERHLRDSSIVFLCVSGEHLTEGKDLTSISYKAETPRMNLSLSELRQIDTSLPPVVIIIMQYDRCCHLPDEEIIETIKKLFDPLFVPNGEWLVTVTPVSLGKGLAKDASGAAIEPLNIHLPISFAIYHTFKKVLTDVSHDKRRRSDGSQVLDEDFYKTWSFRSDVELERRNVLDEHFQEAMTLISSELNQDARIFWNGEEVRLDV